MKSPTHQVELDFGTWHSVVESDRFGLNETNVVVLEGHSDSFFVGTDCNGENLVAFGSTGLPSAHKVYRFVLRGSLTFLTSHPAGHVTLVGPHKETFREGAQTDHIILAVFVSKGVVKVVTQLLVFDIVHFTVKRTGNQLGSIQPAVFRKSAGLFANARKRRLHLKIAVCHFEQRKDLRA